MVMYRRKLNDRCPSLEFLEGIQPRMQRRFRGQVQSMGNSDNPVECCNQYRFKPLHGSAKPLWEFKEGDHRLLCVRIVDGKNLTIVMLSGWVKGGDGKIRETREIEKAQDLATEFFNEYPHGGI